MSTVNRALKPYPPCDISLVDTSTVGVWTPAELTQAVAWYKPGNMIASDNDLMSTVEDFIGTNDGTASGSRRPTFKTNSGDPYLLFGGAQDLLTPITTAFGDLAVIAVVEFNTTLSAKRLVDKNYNSGFWCGFQPAGGNNLGGGLLEGSAPYGDFVSISTGVRYTFLFERSGTTKRIRINGSQTTYTGESGTACDTSPLYIGSDAGTQFGDFKLFELIVCNDNLSSTDVTDLNTYTNNEYGLNF